MRPSPFAFTPVEQVAIEAIREKRPAVLASLSEGLAPVLEDLSEPCLLARHLLAEARGEFVRRVVGTKWN